MHDMKLNWEGHFWTIAPWLRRQLRKLPQVPAAPFGMRFEDPEAGALVVRGHVRHRSDSHSLLLLVHGLGGASDSPYLVAAAAAAERAGVASLRLSMRGAGGEPDIYHAGLYRDLHIALSSSELARYERVFLLGYSLGGHIALRYAASGQADPRLRAVVTICSPLDLSRAVLAIDQANRWLYRMNILSSLKSMYAMVAQRRGAWYPVRAAQAITTMREWDACVTGPRFGYTSVDRYYAAESAGPRLADIRVPTLFIAANADPVVPADTIRPALDAAGPLPHLDVRWLSPGGHISFPQGVSLGFEPAIGLESQVLHWMLQHT